MAEAACDRMRRSNLLGKREALCALQAAAWGRDAVLLRDEDIAVRLPSAFFCATQKIGAPASTGSHRRGG